MDELVLIISWLFIITIFLTILDFYPQLRSFCFLLTPAYHILLIILWGLSILAAYLLKSQVFKDGDIVAVLVLSSLGTFSVVQSFTLQFADYRLISLSELISGFKESVRRDAREKRSKRERTNTQKATKKLSEKESITEEELELEFELLLSQKRSREQIQKMVTQTKNDALQKGLKPRILLAHRIAQMDLDRAK